MESKHQYVVVPMHETILRCLKIKRKVGQKYPEPSFNVLNPNEWNAMVVPRAQVDSQNVIQILIIVLILTFYILLHVIITID